MKKKLVAMVLTVGVIWGAIGCGSTESTATDETTVPIEVAESIEEHPEVVTEIAETGVEEVTETEGEETPEEILVAAHTEYLKQNYIIANWDYTDFQTGDTSHEEWVANRETQMAIHAAIDYNGELFVGSYFDFANGMKYYLLGTQYVMEEIAEGDKEACDRVVFSPISRLFPTFTFWLEEDVVEGYENCYILTSEGYGNDFVAVNTYYIDKDTYRLEKYTSADWEAYNAILELPSEDMCMEAEEVAEYYE